MLRRRPRAHARVRIITFIGPVGVGKSTQIRLLKDYLKLENVRVTETFIKSTHALAYILSRFLIALGECEKVSFSEGITRLYPRKDVMKRLFPLWCFLDTLSIAAKFFFTVYVPFCFGFTPLVEEGLIMTLYTYRRALPVFFEIEPKVPSLLLSLLGWVMSKNHVNVVLDATDDDLKQRRRNREYRQNESSVYISMQKRWMKRLNSQNTIFIDTTGETAGQVHKNIVMALEKHIRALLGECTPFRIPIHAREQEI